MSRNSDPVATAAEYIALQLHPKEIRGDFVRNIRVFYHADEIVYVLQALSSGMAGLFVGLLTNHLYDKAKKPDQKLTDIEALLHKQQEKLAKLEALIAKERKKELAGIARQHFDTHKHTIEMIQDSDPYITSLMDAALSDLDARGQQALTDEIDSHFK